MTTVNHYTDFSNAKKYAKDYHAVISIGWYLPEEFRKNKKYLFLDFEDVSFADLETNPDDKQHAPTAEHITKLVKFINELSFTDKLLIHCFAGYSRSPAAVIIAKCEREGKTIWTAKQELHDARIPDKLTPDPNDIMVNQYLMLKK